MNSPERQSGEQRRVNDPRRQTDPHAADTARKTPTVTTYVDPYDVRAEPQPEEPGYGHGV